MQRRFPLPIAAILLAAPVTLNIAHAAEAGGYCTREQTLDKDQLAATLIRTYPVSTAYLSVGKEPAPLNSPRALVAWLLQKRAMEKSGGQPCQGDICHDLRVAYGWPFAPVSEPACIERISIKPTTKYPVL